MVKQLFEEMICRRHAEIDLPENVSENEYKVTLAAENTADSTLRAGDEIHLSLDHGTFCLRKRNGKVINADICVNVPAEEAVKLSLLNACFRIRRAERGLLKAVIVRPDSIARSGRMEWCWLH